MTAMRETVVGLFVVAGVILALAAVLLFGRLHVLSPVQRAVIYFHGGVGGLAPGAAVTFRGVRVGSVDSVALHVNPVDLQASIPVTLTLDPGRVVLDRPATRSEQLDLAQLVAAGLYGQMTLQSFVTGQMSVDLDLRPNSGASFSGNRSDLIEIPAVQSDFERLREQIPKIPIQDLANKAEHTLSSIGRLADTMNVALPPLIASLQKTVDGLQGTGATVDDSVVAVREKALSTLEHYDALSHELRTQVALRGPELHRLIETADQAAANARSLSAELDRLAGPRSEDRLNLDAALRNAAATSDSLRGVARDVEADPSLLLRGRGR